MGCVVNGPGESKMADVGVAGGKGKGAIYRKGELVGTYPEGRPARHAAPRDREGHRRAVSRLTSTRPRMASNSPRLPSRRSLLATVAISAVAAAMVSLSSPASLRIDGQKMFSDVPPVTTPKGEVFVPLRVVAETLGARNELRCQERPRSSSRAGRRHLAHESRRKARDAQRQPHDAQARAVFGARTHDGRRSASSRVPSIRRSHYDGAHAKIDVMTPGLIEAGAQQDQP